MKNQLQVSVCLVFILMFSAFACDECEEQGTFCENDSRMTCMYKDDYEEEDDYWDDDDEDDDGGILTLLLDIIILASDDRYVKHEMENCLAKGAHCVEHEDDDGDSYAVCEATLF